MRLCWVVLFAAGLLDLEESPISLELLAAPSAEKVLGGNKKVKMTAQKSSCRRTQRELLDNLMGCFTLIGSNVRPLYWYTFVALSS